MRVIVTVILVFLLAACGSVNGPTPTKALVKKAIAFELLQTQQQLSTKLRATSRPSVEIKGIRMSKTEFFELQDLPAFHITGTYDLNLTYPNHPVTQQQNPFDVYLQRQSASQTWRLAQRQASGTWITYGFMDN